MCYFPKFQFKLDFLMEINIKRYCLFDKKISQIKMKKFICLVSIKKFYFIVNNAAIYLNLLLWLRYT